MEPLIFLDSYWHYFLLLLYGWVFFLGVSIFLYLPAEFLFSHSGSPLTGWRRVTLLLPAGMVIVTFLGYILRFIDAKQLLGPLLLMFAVGAILRMKHWGKYVLTGWGGPHGFLFILSLIYSLSVVTSGWMSKGGIYLIGANWGDAMWNLSVVRELQNHFPPQHPGAVGLLLTGYHIWYNLLLTELARLIPVPLLHLHFQFLSSLIAILYVYLSYEIAQRIGKSRGAALWSVFFVVLGGSFSFIIRYFYHQPVSIDDAFGITQPVSRLENPSFAISIVLLFSFFLIFDEYIKRASRWLLLLLALFVGTAVGYKVYGGVLACGVLAVMSIFVFLKHKKIEIFIACGISALIAAFVFFPSNAHYGFLVYQPLWPPHRIMTGPLAFTKWELKRQTILSIGSMKGLIKLEAIALVLFVVGNLGTRLVALFALWPIRKYNVTPLGGMLLISSILSFFLPLFFIQPIGTFNMIQFYWYFLSIVGIFTGCGVYHLMCRIPNRVRYPIVICIILFTLPSAFVKVVPLLPFPYGTPASISSVELELYDRLASMGSYDNTVLEIPNLSTYSREDFRRWFYYENALKVPVFGNKRLFFKNEVVQFPYDEWAPARLELMNQFMTPQSGGSTSIAYEALQKMGIFSAIRYIVTPLANPWFSSESRFRLVYKNSYGSIYEVLPL